MVHSGLARVAPSVCQSSGYNSSLDRLHGPHSGYHLLLLLSRWPASLQGASSPYTALPWLYLLLSVLSLLYNVYCSPSEFFECEYELRCPGPHKKKKFQPLVWISILCLFWIPCFVRLGYDGLPGAKEGVPLPGGEAGQGGGDQGAGRLPQQGAKQQGGGSREAGRKQKKPTLWVWSAAQPSKSFWVKPEPGLSELQQWPAKGQEGIIQSSCSGWGNSNGGSGELRPGGLGHFPGLDGIGLHLLGIADEHNGDRVAGGCGQQASYHCLTQVGLLAKVLALFRKLQPMLLSNMRNHKTSQLQDVFVFIIVF